MTGNISKQFVCSLVATVVIALASAPAPAQSRLSARETASEINAANKLLRDGKVNEALEAFRRVAPGDQQRDELNYNMAVAEYRSGNIDGAEKLFSEVAGTSTPAISSNSRYNLGNCQYAKAVQVAEQDKPAAIEHLRNAVSHYRGALRGNSNNPDARANIELAGELIRKLEQEQKQQEEQKKQEQEQQEKEDKKNEDQQQDQKDQSEQKDDSQKDSEQQKSDSEDSKSDQQKNEEQKDQSEASASDESEKDEQDAKKNEKPGDESQKADDQKSPGEDSQSSPQEPSEQQSQPKGSDGKKAEPQNMQQQSGDQQQPDDAGNPDEEEAKNQPVPAGDLKAADQQNEDKKPVGSGAMADPTARDGLMTREEALKMLQSVRDRDMLRRMQQQRQERSRHVPVDRDW